MKEVVNMNIGSQAFVLDKDACTVLEEYLDDIRSRLPEGDNETLIDVETRLAEIFRERFSSPMQVVTLDAVRAAMAQMGSPADFGECRAASSQPQEHAHKLYRSRTNRSIGGVCGGLADYFDLDPTLIRLVTLGLIVFGGLSIWIYILLWIIIPEAPARKFNLKR